jgi:hypothetical protein
MASWTWCHSGKRLLLRFGLMTPLFSLSLMSFFLGDEQAPHHSRASWMKYWRRHKHELEPDDSSVDEPLPLPPEKKMRYSKDDDVLLAKFFYSKPDGTSDKVFQQFGRMVRTLFLSPIFLVTKFSLIVIVSASSLERLARTSSVAQVEDRPHG